MAAMSAYGTKRTNRYVSLFVRFRLKLTSGEVATRFG
jgi:hypothetical protein